MPGQPVFPIWPLFRRHASSTLHFQHTPAASSSMNHADFSLFDPHPELQQNAVSSFNWQPPQCFTLRKPGYIDLSSNRPPTILSSPSTATAADLTEPSTLFFSNFRSIQRDLQPETQSVCLIRNLCNGEGNDSSPWQQTDPICPDLLHLQSATFCN